MAKKLISIFIPCYNEESNVLRAYRALKNIEKGVKKYTFEYIYIDNGSTDKTKNEIHSLALSDKKVKGIYLTRNFGPESSSKAGLDYTKGDAVILFPCDLQEPAELIPTFVNKWEEGNDSVLGIYTKLEDPFPMVFLRRLFYRIMKNISDIDIPINNSGFGLYSRKVVTAMLSLPEKFRFERGIRAWVGFKTAYVSYERRKRQGGRSSYSFFGYIHHAERSIFGFSYLPLDMLIYFGLLLVFISFLFIVGYILFFLLFGNPIKGAVTILVAIVFFGGINLLAISIIGKYIQVIMEETKGRPSYIVESVDNINIRNRYD